MAPTLDYLSPKDYHYLLWGLADITDSGHELLSFDKVPEAHQSFNARPNGSGSQSGT